MGNWLRENFFEKLKWVHWRDFWIKMRRSNGRVSAELQKKLVADRPAHLDPYEMLIDGEVIDESFERLRLRMFAAVEETGTKGRLMFKEHGRLAGNRRYFYVQPSGELGFLFERSGDGWVVSRATKVAAQELFLRTEGALDIVALYRHVARREGEARVSSARLGINYLPETVYESKLRHVIGLSDGVER